MRGRSSEVERQLPKLNVGGSIPPGRSKEFNHLTSLLPGEPEPTKYWLSTLPADTSIETLVDTAKLRWRIERDYQDLKQELGLGHHEGRGWRGFHHHASLCIAAYGFMVSLRETFPPSAAPRTAAGQAPGLPAGYRPRGSLDPARTPRAQLDRHH